MIVIMAVGLCFSCSLLLDFDTPIMVDGAPVPDAPADSMIAICGDGTMAGVETCDDGNTTALDGCSPQCQTEAGYVCGGVPSSCSPGDSCPTQEVNNVSVILESCRSYYDSGYRASGRYQIDVDGAGPRNAFHVLCDMATTGGGWTVLVNNVPDTVEPDGCRPRLATDDSFACGIPSCDVDFAAPAYGIAFTELVWVAHAGDLQIGPHHLFRWDTTQMLPSTPTWSLVAEQSNLLLPGFEAESLIQCLALTTPGLSRVANENPRTALGGYLTTDVVTYFDSDLNPATGGSMSLTDVSNSLGLDDFQDGSGCSDMWEPIASRGSASMIMIR